MAAINFKIHVYVVVHVDAYKVWVVLNMQSVHNIAVVCKS